ncbi:hypothetical protein PV327_002010, partial [Microctonus hyperodae]
MRKTKGQVTMISSPGVAAAADGGTANIEASRPCCACTFILAAIDLCNIETKE